MEHGEIPALFLSNDRYSLTRETLLTPAQAAVLAAVDRWVEAKESYPMQRAECDAADELIAAVTTLRAQGGE
jgi:hypothetical protein